MVSMLRLTDRIQADETLASFVGRLGAMNHQPSTDDFCRDMKTTLHAVAIGDTDAIAKIARVSGNHPDVLERAAFKRRDSHSLTFRGQTLTNAARTSVNVRFCTECLKQDIAHAAARGMRRPHHHVYGRPQWHVAQYRTCTRHGIQLASAATGGGSRRHDFTGTVLPLLDHLEELGKCQVRRAAGGLETYLEGRIFRPGGGFLDELGFSVTARFCELLGAVALGGPWPPHLGFSDEQWQLCGAAGYRIASGGPDSIRRFLLGLKKMAERDSRDEAHNDWGILYNWLGDTRDPELGPLLELARDHIEANYPVGVGKRVLGRRVKARKMHSVYSASREYRVHVKVLRTQLAAAGVFTDDESLADNHILFPSEPNRTLLERISRGVSILHARERINCERQVFGPLVEAGVLAPITPVQSGYILFDTKDLDAFAAGLIENAVPYASKPAGLETIAKTRMKLMCSHPEIVRLILADKLKTVGMLENERGYAAILVDPAEVSPFVRGDELDGIVVTDIAADLGVPFAGAAKMLNVHLPTVWRIHPHRRHPQQVVDQHVYSQFKTKYVSLRDLSRQAGLNAKKYQVQLRTRGINPEPGFPSKVYLYLRDRFQ